MCHVTTAMRSALKHGVDPRNSHAAFAARFERQERDRARHAEERHPYPFHVTCLNLSVLRSGGAL